MLILSRKKDETVIVGLPDGRTVEVKLVEIRGDKVRLGFTADKDVPVHRKEVWDLVKGDK